MSWIDSALWGLGLLVGGGLFVLLMCMLLGVLGANVIM